MMTKCYLVLSLVRSKHQIWVRESDCHLTTVRSAIPNIRYLNPNHKS